MFDRLQSLFVHNQKEFKTKESNSQFENISLTPAYQQTRPAEPTTTEQLNSYKSWIYSALYLRASMVAGMELVLYKKIGNDVEVVQEHPALDLFDKVNNQMTFYGLMKYSSVIRNLTGECYWYLLLDKQGEPIEIYPWLRPDRIQVVPGKDMNEFIKGFVYTPLGSGTPIPLGLDEVVQFTYPNPMDPYRGQSPIKAAAMAIESDRSAASWNWRFFKNNGVPRGVINIKSRYSEPLFKQLRETWEEGHGGESNANKVAFLFSGANGNDIAFQEIGISQKDMDFLKQREFDRDEILSVLGVPYSILNPTENVSRATVEASQVSLITNTIKPEDREWIEEINEFLLPRFKNSEGLFFDFKDPTPEDNESKIAKYDNALKYGWMTIDEVRKEEGLSPKEDDDTEEDVDEDDVKNVKYMKLNVNYKKNVRGANIEKKMKEALEKNKDVIKKIIGEKKKPIVKKNKVSQAFEDKGLKFWKKKIFRTDQMEIRMMEDLDRFFSQQNKRVQNTIQTKRAKRWGKVKEISYNYDLDNENAALSSLIEPYYKEAIFMFGEEALRGLNLRTEFKTTDAIKKYIEKYSLKGAKEINQVTKDQIADQLKIAIDNGESIPQISKRIKGVFQEASDMRAKMIARTEISRASNAGSYYGYIQSGVVEKVKWWTALDERVCWECNAMHGQEEILGETFFDKGETQTGEVTNEQGESKSVSVTHDYEAILHPPLHPRCRCVLLPLTTGSKEYVDMIEKDIDIKYRSEYEKKEKQLKEKEENINQEKQKLENLLDQLEDDTN